MSDQSEIRQAQFRSALQNERDRQLRKWGAQAHTPPEWLAILMEEVGEAAKAWCEGWTTGEPHSDMLGELVQVAAVAEAAYVDLSGHMTDTGADQ